jgi:hypothetical protein
VLGHLKSLFQDINKLAVFSRRVGEIREGEYEKYKEAEWKSKDYETNNGPSEIQCNHCNRPLD